MKKFFTVVFWLLFTLMFTLVLLLGEVRLYVLTPAFLKDALRETQTYRKLVKNPDILTSQLQGQGGTSPAPQAPGQNAPVPQAPGPNATAGQISYLEQRITQAVVKSMDEKWLERETEKMVDGIYNYAMSDQQQPNISVDLRDFKAKFRNNLDPLLLEEYSKMPEVPVEQFDQQMAQNPGKFPVTRPVGFTLEQMLAKIGMNPVDDIMKSVPDKYDADFVGTNTQSPLSELEGLKQIRPVLNTASLVFWITLVVTLLLLLLFAKLTSKGFMEFLMRLGIYLTAALAPLILFVILWYVLVNILLPQAMIGFNLPSQAVKQIVEPLIAFVINRTSLHLIAWSGGIAMVGLVMAISTGISLRRKPSVPKPAEQKPVPEPKPAQ